ncbi:hypothetical protein NQ314_017584 [Rhamnusium bicolor]|uniref:Uncharacterized protein n=1 Tax=Rhamnusium bicolor TaxID=1586634 RepID=A0AAV8WUE5_9CUCU|nr:hypothetical protein NQ314_017584 [Rhamnusium bicolor]
MNKPDSEMSFASDILSQDEQALILHDIGDMADVNVMANIFNETTTDMNPPDNEVMEVQISKPAITECLFNNPKQLSPTGETSCTPKASQVTRSSRLIKAPIKFMIL